ncbi:hypothetical protein EIN_417410 [Entamoeba invadens IP1]|uniref:Uncharacterized protein n=1 Tax=Entamoeba invadens IP1 TaxID=370355 RepID=A0A0A1TUG0_ENTIV|nr:hypothetical protein EIN_417410 [Entamoeba invadens IP1]ELP83632.1 hypothetical protein EIN_417410 [Entamoeba invadens IP1]|eukprot:XP_004182978.1 hypothetical protein EIN_417410 [Entamoeba invadens IP1]
MCSEEDKCDFQVHNQMGLNALDILVKIALNLTVNGSVVSSNGETLRQDLGVAVALKYNEIDSRFQLVVDLNKFQNFSESMMVNGECWKGLMENGTGIPTIKVDTALDSFKVTAESVDIHEGIQTVINALSDIVVYTYKDTFPVLANGFANEVVRTSMNEGIENATIEECDYIVDPPFMSFDHEFVLIGVIVSVILGLIFCAIAIGFLFVRKREMKKKAEELQRTGGVLLSPEQVSVLSNETGVEKNEGDALIHEGEDEKSLWKKMSEKVVWFFKQYIRTDHEGVSMFLDDRISIIIRVIVPLVIFLTFAVFITDKTGIGCAVRVFVLFGNNNKINALVSSYGLMDTVTNMWHAGIYPLAILILLFSCIWPYTKLILLFFTWTTPPTIMSTKVRYRILYVLDALGKWSFLDSYVMTLMVVSFYFNVPLPIYHPENVTTPMKIQLWVDPEFCFTALVAGTIVTLLLSHVMLYIHEDILSSKTDNIGSEAVHKRPLFMYSRFIFVRILVVVLIIISMILVIVGMLLNSFSFDFMGMTGWALDLLNYPQHRIFSIMDLGIQLPGDTREPNSFVVRFIQVTYFVTIVAIPLLHMIMMLFLWVTPMTRKVQFYVLKMCQILYAWSCIDVFIISVIAAVVQLSQFAAFMVEPFCGKTIPAIGMSFDELIGKYLGDKKYVKGHETCFEVMAVLTSGCWTLFAGVIVYTVASLFITKISKKALDKRLPTQEEIDRYKAERREEDKLPLLEGTV